MRTKDFREIQVSSTLLVVIFLCVLVLGVFIFLLGVSVGKKQVQITAANQVVAQKIQEPAKDQAAEISGKQDQASDKPLMAPPAGSSSTTPAAEPQKPAPKTTTGPSTKSAAKPGSSAPSTGAFYVQIAAFTDRTQAIAEADKFKKRGYPVVVVEPRPTDTKTWYRVRVGSYSTREKAAEILTKLNEAAKKKTDYRIIKD